MTDAKAGAGRFALDGPFWRRLARLGASHGPEWFVRLAPPLIGLAVCAGAPGPRRAIADNLRRVRGPRGRLREALDVGRTFASYASCLAEVLAAGSARGRLPAAVVWGERHFEEARAGGTGVVFATAHTGGWEAVGPLLSRDYGLPLIIAEAAERDETARSIQDGARRAHGLVVAHVGVDPLSALPLAKHLREGGAVALQVDRVPAGVRCREVTVFEQRTRLPEGPLRLAALTGAPIVPIFSARTGHRRYEVFLSPPIRLVRAAGDAELDFAAQRLADAMQDFLRGHPTQWFHFRKE